MNLNDKTRAMLGAVSTATLTTQLLKRGYRNIFMQGVRPLLPPPPSLGTAGGTAGNMVGVAVTLRYIPAREDLATMESLGSREHPQRKTIETIPAGAVLVMDCRGEAGVAAAGAILVARMQARGAAGLVADGGIRDAATAASLGLPIYCAGPAAPPNVARHLAADMNVPIGCGGVAVFPGDVVVGDGDGVVVIPAALADEVAAAATEQDRLEDFLLAEIRGGRSLFGVYPPDDATLQRYRSRREPND